MEPRINESLVLVIRTISLAPEIVKYMEKNVDTTRPRLMFFQSEISGFKCGQGLGVYFLIKNNYKKKLQDFGQVLTSAELGFSLTISSLV